MSSSIPPSTPGKPWQPPAPEDLAPELPRYEILGLLGLWRLLHQRTWISQGQLLHVQSRLEEAGRMVGGWMRKGAAV